MANYINKDILCQAYIHIDPVPIDGAELEQFKTTINDFLSARGKFFIYEEVDADVELKDGSLRVYATILGSLYLGISQYGSFRSGVDYLASDVKRLSESIVSESLFQSKSRHDNIIRAEARIGVAGSLKQLVDEIDFISSRIGHDTPRSLSKRLERLSENLQKLINNLNDPEDIPFIKTNIEAIVVEKIQEQPYKPPRSPEDPEGNQLYALSRRQFLELVMT
jgi:hypothetical protein